MARRGSSIPKPLRPFVGGAVLVATVRVIDVAWCRITGRPTPVDARATEADARAGESAVVRDRLVYALLLGGALRAARRLGLPEDASHDASRDADAGEDAGRG
jgi:hypothetical protein